MDYWKLFVQISSKKPKFGHTVQLVSNGNSLSVEFEKNVVFL